MNVQELKSGAFRSLLRLRNSPFRFLKTPLFSNKKYLTKSISGGNSIRIFSLKRESNDSIPSQWDSPKSSKFINLKNY